MSWDVLVLIFLFLAAFLYGFFLNKNKIILIIFSAYISFSLIVSLKDFENLVRKDDLFFARLGAFIFFIIFVCYLLNRSFVGNTLKFSQESSFSIEFLKKLVLSLAQIGLFISIFLNVILTEEIISVAMVTEVLFMNHAALTAWLATPILLVGIFKK